MFDAEKLFRHKLFSSCKFHTPIFCKTVSGLSLYSELEGPENTDTIILAHGSELAVSPGIPAVLDRLVSCRAAGLMINAGSMDRIAMDDLAQECTKRRLILGELLAPMTSIRLIRDFYQLIPSAFTGEVTSYSEVLKRFQAAFFSFGLDRLLCELHEWTGCQCALVVGQDTYVYPGTPMLDSLLFSPVRLRNETPPSPFTHVRQYASSDPPVLLLQADLYKNQLPFGQMFLIGNGRDFRPQDYDLLNYASILCTGLGNMDMRSRQIGDLISSLCLGQQPEDSSIELLPPSGYGIVLYCVNGRETDGKNSPAVIGTSEYLSYLIHHHFPEELCYSLDHNDIRLFISTKDADHFSRKLISVLNRTGRYYHAGISRQYSRCQAATAFSEASHAAKMAQLLGYEQNPCFFQELGIYRLFAYPENPWPVDQMLEEMNKLLDGMDNEKKDILTLTVRTFVKNHFNYQKTADELYTHVNTIRYRIHQLEDIWNVDLASNEGRLLFGVLSKLLPLWMKKDPLE